MFPSHTLAPFGPHRLPRDLAFVIASFLFELACLLACCACLLCLLQVARRQRLRHSPPSNLPSFTNLSSKPRDSGTDSSSTPPLSHHPRHPPRRRHGDHHTPSPPQLTHPGLSLQECPERRLPPPATPRGQHRLRICFPRRFRPSFKEPRAGRLLQSHLRLPKRPSQES